MWDLKTGRGSKFMLCLKSIHGILSLFIYLFPYYYISWYLFSSHQNLDHKATNSPIFIIYFNYIFEHYINIFVFVFFIKKKYNMIINELFCFNIPNYLTFYLYIELSLFFFFFYFYAYKNVIISLLPKMNSHFHVRDWLYYIEMLAHEKVQIY